MIRREGELRVIFRRRRVIAAEVATNTDMIRREGELRVIFRRHRAIAAEEVENTDVRLAWTINVSPQILHN